MEKFLAQFLLTPGMAVALEASIFRNADTMVEGYHGGTWKDSTLGDVLTVTIPGKDPLVTLHNRLNGTSITTDRQTASVAFLTLVVNWFWHHVNDNISDESQEAFYNYHHALKDAVYADNSGINHDDYFAFTD